MFHFQDTPNDWPQGVAKLPDKSCVKAVDRGDILRDAKVHKPGIFTILRHWDDSLQHYDGNMDLQVWKDRARHWFSTHIDGTFRQQYAPHVDAVSWHNEIWANSQTDAERKERIIATQAAISVWNGEYRNQPDYQHIRLVIGEAAVGNWMPWQIGKLAVNNDCIVGYHPYTAWGWDNKPKTRWGEDEFDNEPWDTLDWYNLSGLWDTMEHDWGWYPNWAFTEAGPFSNVFNGWRAPEVCGADPNLYVTAVRDWLKDVQLTDAYKQGRVLGFTLFTSGGGQKWRYFETRQPEMDMLADMIAAEWKPGTIDPPPPPPPPDDKSFKEKAWRVTSEMQQTGQGGIQLNPKAGIQERIAADSQAGDLDLQVVTAETGVNGKTVQAAESLTGKVGRRVYVWEAGQPITWFGDPAEREIVDVVGALPTHESKRYKTRPLTDITTLVIHHTVSPCDRSTAAIANFHVEKRDWPGIGYHYVIGCDGVIEQTNYNETISFHAGVRGYNNNEISLGIALKDDFTDHPPTQQALDAARWLVQQLKAQFNNLEVVRHRDMPGAQTACPGKTSPYWIDYIAGE